MTLRQKLSDTGLPLSRTQAHTASHLLAPDNSFAPGAMNGVLLSSQNQLQHTCLLLSRSYCSSMNSRGLEQRETGTHVTALTLWPRYQPPFFLLGDKHFPGLSFTATEPFCALDQCLHRACFLSLLATALFRRIKHSQAVQTFNE